MTQFSSIGYLTYKRTYARYLDSSLGPESPTEEWSDTVERVIDSCKRQFKVGFTEDEEDRFREYMLDLKCSVAGRYLWQCGTDTIDRFGLASLQNCALTLVNDPIRPFVWAMDMLCLGAGVGFNIQREYIDQIPEVKPWFKAPTRFDDGGADFIVPDSREGWVKLLGKTLKAAFLSDEPERGTFTYSTQIIRTQGMPIKGFGGVASGSQALCLGIAKISKVLEKRRGRKIRPIDGLDIMNIIGELVISGNVRRSAQIALFDPDDIECLLAKRWDLGNIPSHRAMSNNSVICNDLDDLHEYFWDTYTGRGEPLGLINLDLSKKVGRLGETQYPDPNIVGYNPCAEQSLEDKETCSLSTVFLPNVESKEEFLDIVELLYKINKHSLLLPSHHKDTEKVVHKNMRMGINVTGVLQATAEQYSWLSDGYEYIRDFDKKYSEVNKMRPSIKLTTVQPSGTLSLLPGVTSGVHPAYAQYLYRRIRIASNHPLVDICRKNGYPVEYAKNFDGSEEYGTVVVTFPFRYPEGTKLAKDMTAIDQLLEVKKLQAVWSDNAVSCTVYYKKEELPEIRKYLEENYKDHHKSLSFLLHSEHGFIQAPLEEITKEQYEDLVAKTKPITYIDMHLEMDETEECAMGVCPVK